MKLNDRFKTGKHKGSTLREVLEKDHLYVGWCIMHIKGFGFIDGECHELLQLMIESSIPGTKELSSYMSINDPIIL